MVAAYLGLGLAFHAYTLSRQPGDGAPAVTDFNTFYAVGMLLTRAPAEAAYDNARLAPVEREAVARLYGDRVSPGDLAGIGVFGWYYPPILLLVLPLLPLLPYPLAYLAWGVATFAPLAAALRRITGGGGALLPALAFPGTLINGLFGQNGFLSAGLMGLGLALLERRPLLAGMCLGTLAYKPQLGLLLPLALVAGRHWRALAAAAATASALAGLSAALFGLSAWQAFLAGSPRAADLMEHAAPWVMMPSAFAAIRLAGGPVPLAYGLQAAVAAAAAVAVVWGWRRPAAPFRLKAALVCLATPLVTPFGYTYDLMLLVPGLAWLLMDIRATGWRPGEALAVTAAVLLPFAASALANLTGLQIGPLVLAGLAWVVIARLRRSFNDLAGPVDGVA